MKFHIWKPQPERWIIIDTSDGSLYDVSKIKKYYSVSERSPVLDYKTIVKVIETFERVIQPDSFERQDVVVMNFEVK